MTQPENSPKSLRAESIAGMCSIGALVTGCAGLLVALAAFLDGLNYTGTGLALLAAAVAFGMLANVIFRS